MSYPAVLEVETPERIARWRPLFAWFLAIPHFIVLYALGMLGSIVAFISWFVILFTGKLPDGLAGIQVMCLRYQERATIYAGFLHEKYPPFEFPTDSRDPGTTPVTLDIIPALEGRNRLTVGLRFIWVIPAMIWVMIVWIAVSVVYFVAWFAVIILGRWPQGMRDFVVKGIRLAIQVNVYASLLTDQYPPFSLTPDGSGAGDTPPPPPQTDLPSMLD